MIAPITTDPSSFKDKHSGYSSTYHDKNAAQYYQRKFSRSLSSRLSNAREKQLIGKALRMAGRLAGKQTKDLTILDYPCGAGRFATLLASRTAGYYAGDHSPHMVELAKQTLLDHGMADSLIETTVGDIKANTLADHCVDLAASIRLLHHFPDRADRITILSELKRVCKGQLITTFIDANSIKQRLYQWKKKRAGKPCTRVILSVPQFIEEANEAGWTFVKSWSLASLSSGLRIVLLTSDC